jgi:hypothetical protein
MKTVTIVLLTLICITLNAQNYTFSNLTGSYSNLTGTTSISNGEIWDDPEYSLQLPFNINVNGTSGNLFTIYDGTMLLANNTSAQGFFIFFADLEDRGSNGSTSLSPISYKIDGAVGSRIVKIEFKNCGAYSDFSKTMFINFQVWLYESSNIIEYHYGPSSITNPSLFYDEQTGPVVGFTGVDEENEFIDSYLLTGAANSPTLSTTSNFSFLNGTPSANRIFRFTPTNLSTTEVSKSQVSIYPNPFKDLISIQGGDQNFSYAIYDLHGKIVQSSYLSKSEDTINTASIASGVYILKITTSETTVTKKMVKL